MSNSPLRICVWSGPRNISTALMYSFAQRSDTTVVDEALYGHYLSKTPAEAYHPGSAEIIATMDNDGERVVRDILLGPYNTPIVFHKQMTHHLVELDWGFMAQTINVILTRDPVDMLPSYMKNVERPTMVDVGYAKHIKLLNYLRSLGQEPPVLDSKQVLLNPRKVLTALCEQIGIPFDEAMLTWDAGARLEDGCWAKDWYHSVHRSTGFGAYRPKSAPFPDSLKPLLAECLPYYEQLSQLAISGEAAN
ncbi:MAG: sulfotransferase family protein [Candidatus Promineifilaceae bacterium]